MTESGSCNAFIALGSNLGDRKGNILMAMAALDGLSAVPVRRSSLWASEPVDCPPESGEFINAAVLMVTPLSPRQLLEALQTVENSFGRVRRVRNEPRLLDLDILSMGSFQMNTPDLVLPHPRIGDRRFVLAPLVELDPHLILPGRVESVSDLLKKAPGMEIRKIPV